MKERYFLWTVGCQMNIADSEKLAAGFERLGMESVSAAEGADIVVINTCSVRQHAEDRAYSQLGRIRLLKEARPSLKVAVMGCMVGMRTRDLERRFPFVDVFAPPQQFKSIMELVEEPMEDFGGEFWPATFAVPEGPTAFVPVVHGCDKFCTYCIVPYRRGRERSRPVDEIVREVSYLTANDVREVTLLGQTVEAYGHDLQGTPDLGDLMRELSSIEHLSRIRFLTSYPKDMTSRILEAVAELPKVMECFSLPVQAGSDAVLQSMRRGYSKTEYIEKVREVRTLMPNAGITTDVIVGYPGETDDQFGETLQLLEDLRFDKVHTAAYSARPGTIADRKFPDDVPTDVKSERLHRVQAVEERISLELNEAYLGTVEIILVEGINKRGQPYGRTRTGKLVNVDTAARVGSLIDVSINHAGPFALRGAPVDSLAVVT
ncbi:MAG: tRNA (N6-isopentenyl adenosine(37)-C2)-methylthiotransferase MiaB [Dehalococcoidia bacterium]|nr:tRNA (N6-isopentenyl adenosine(37)-C2)-methylthiotransferase MiaB [Dehalococcoidia bacterium]HCV00275.1 tRNA (N6-isopentenyl adenosine(37)-C2)-methylthiotransferase MiaB [Dehalococcoidia bacterium]|tara:strand:- start:9423 stop:10721 length:1299 start_codon:yes stop_codon:yes gene_type:complete